MKKLIVLNHKMNLEYDEVIPYITKLNQIETSNDLVVLPTFTYLESFIGNCKWGVGAQNVSGHDMGNYTGEVSVIQLKSMGIEYVMIGHYERRKYFGETVKDIREKLNACLDANVIPILCFGATGNRDDIYQELDEILEGVVNIHFIVFAYEPLQVVEQNDIDSVREQVLGIYDYLYGKYKCVPNLIYGGGIKLDNVRKVLEIEKLNGILIGKVSSDINKVCKIVKSLDS